MIDAFGPPIEKLLLALIQECIAQILPETNGPSPKPDPYTHRRTISVTPRVRSENARGI
jgi:hypothetical protein